MNTFTGRKVAIDASMAIYQFLIAVRSMGANGNGASASLTNEAGEVTSHIQGMFSRTIKMMEAGCKPAYVFDGKPPDMKGGTLLKRKENRDKAEAELAAAKENDDAELINKFQSRLVKVGKKENDDCKHLLRLMGVPVVEAPCEAEAQCAELAKGGKVYATATEDMDALTFRTPKLLRKMTFASGNKQPIVEIDVAAVLTGLDLCYDSFVDLCIMMGCDYCGTIKGVGPKTALTLIRQYKSLENVVKALLKNPKTKNNVPAEYTTQRVKREEVKEEEEDKVEAKEEKAVDDFDETDGVEKKLSTDIEGKEGVEEKAESKQAGDASSAEKMDTETTEEDATEAEGKKQAELEAAAKAAKEAKETEEAAEEEELMKNLAAGGAEADMEEDVKIVEEDGVEYITIEPVYIRARSLFHSAEVTPASEFDLKWAEPDEVALREFLVEKMGFQLDRVNNGIKKLQEAQKKKSQGRMDSFFASAGSVTSSTGLKRKAEAPVKGAKGKAVAANKKGSFGKKR